MTFKRSLTFSFICLVIIIGFYLTSLSQLFSYTDFSDLGRYFYKVKQVLIYSGWQSFLSATLTLVFSLFLAKAFSIFNFRGKLVILRLLNTTFILPSILVIFTFIAIYGQQGIVNKLLAFIGIKMNIYGLLGIVLAHSFLNIGYCTNVLYQNLESIPNEQIKLASSLNLSRFRIFSLLDWQYTKNNFFSLWLLVFILSFNSFAIVLFLGGGPKYSTFEVLVFQAISYDFDVTTAATFGIIQLVITSVFIVLNSNVSKLIVTRKLNFNKFVIPAAKLTKILLGIVLGLGVIFICFPMLYIIYDGIVHLFDPRQYTTKDLFQAVFNSIVIGLVGSLLSLAMCFSLLYGLRWLQKNHKIKQYLLNISLLSLIFPSVLLALGFFLISLNFEMNTLMLIALVACANALNSLPFVLRYLQPAFESSIQNWQVSAQLNLTAWQRFKSIEWFYIKKPLVYAFALAFIMSLGDFSIIAFFASPDFTTLPYLLSSQFGGFLRSEGYITAALFLLFIFAIQIIALKYSEEKA